MIPIVLAAQISRCGFTSAAVVAHIRPIRVAMGRLEMRPTVRRRGCHDPERRNCPLPCHAACYWNHMEGYCHCWRRWFHRMGEAQRGRPHARDGIKSVNFGVWWQCVEHVL